MTLFTKTNIVMFFRDDSLHFKGVGTIAESKSFGLEKMGIFSCGPDSFYSHTPSHPPTKKTFIPW